MGNLNSPSSEGLKLLRHWELRVSKLPRFCDFVGRVKVVKFSRTSSLFAFTHIGVLVCDDRFLVVRCDGSGNANFLN